MNGVDALKLKDMIEAVRASQVMVGYDKCRRVGPSGGAVVTCKKCGLMSGRLNLVRAVCGENITYREVWLDITITSPKLQIPSSLDEGEMSLMSAPRVVTIITTPIPGAVVKCWAQRKMVRPSTDNVVLLVGGVDMERMARTMPNGAYLNAYRWPEADRKLRVDVMRFQKQYSSVGDEQGYLRDRDVVLEVLARQLENLTYARGTAVEDLVEFEKQNPWAIGFVTTVDYPEPRASEEEVAGKINRDDVCVTNQQIESMSSMIFKKNRFVGRRLREPTSKYADVPSRGFRKMEAMKHLLPRIDRLKVLDVGSGFTTYVGCVARKAKIFCITLPKAELFDYGAFEKNVSGVGTGSAVKIMYADIIEENMDKEIVEFMSDQVDFVMSDAGERHSSIAEQAAWLTNGYGQALERLVRTHLKLGGCLCLKIMGVGNSLAILRKLALGFSDMRAVSEP